jgi:hypothetical protein
MSSLTAYSALRTWLEANWTQTALRFENEGSYPPSDGAPFVYFETMGGIFDQISVGAGSPNANLWREEGVAMFHCCVANGTGVEIARSYAQTLAQLLKGLTLAPGLSCTSMQIRPGEPFGDGGNYYGVPLITNWYRDA